MAMLAEPKTKQKWSNDPRNTTWTNDTSRFGYQMLTKMGWETGKGLGANEDGATTHIKSLKRKDNLGLGADKSNEDNWLSHQLAFDDLLSKLNDRENGSEDGPKKKKKKHEMEKTARQSRKRVFYNRFIQSKDLSSKSAEDMACILGQRSKSTPGTPQEQSEGEESDTSTSSCPPPTLHGVQIINSGQSIQEYFEKKMKEMKAAREGKVVGEEVDKKEQGSVDEVQENVLENPEKAEDEPKIKKKKKEKGRKRKIATDVFELGSDESGLQLSKDECSAKKKKKNVEKGMRLVDESEADEGQEARNEERKNKKRKGKKFKMTDSEICEDGVQSDIKECVTTEEAKTEKKKDKSNKREDKNTEISYERKERKNKMKKEETCKVTVMEAEESENDKRKKRKTKEKNSISHDSDSVEITINEERGKKKKKKDKSRDSKKKRAE